jgi:FtsP/CotA-like multicopper oxidase with cupredoxin domain
VLNRRDLIKLGLYGGTAGMLHLTRLDSGVLAWALDEVKGNSGSQSQALGALKPFTQALPLPHVIRPVNPSQLPGVKIIPGATYYEVRMRQGTAQLLPGAATVIWRYQDPRHKRLDSETYLGPTFEARIGETTVVRQHNDLLVNTIVHHHGGHTPGVSDGSALASQRVHPGRFKDYIYPNDDDICATHWYHDHDLDFTGHNIFMGLQGCFFLHDAVEHQLNLPGSPRDPAPPGEMPFDLPIVIQDRAFDFNNQLAYNPFGHDGFVGDHFLVNGAIQPSVRVANRKYRLRFVNGSNARFYQPSLSNGMPFHMIGSDGGLLSAATDVKSFLIGPGERYEAIVDFSKLTPGPNTHVYLNNCLAQTNGRGPDGLSNHCTNAHPGPDGVGSLLRFDVAFSAPDPSTFRPGQTLRTDLPIFGSPDVTREWLFERSQGAWQINGKFYDPNRIDAHVKLNTTEVWVLRNGGGGWFHPVHIHRNQFRILDRNGQAPGPLEQGLKDVFVLGAGDTVSVITFYNGNTQIGDYVMHCHNVEHEDMRMMSRWHVS